MSKKDEYLEQARQARIEHKKWVNQVRLIVSGLERNRETLVLNPSESHFGVWLYSKATVYTISNSRLVLNEIEHLFDECYEEYHKIYALLFKENNNGFLKSFFGLQKASESDYKIAEQHYEIILEKSDKLFNKLRVFENQLSATSFEKFDRALQDEDTIVEEIIQTSKQKEQRYYRGSLIED